MVFSFFSRIMSCFKEYPLQYGSILMCGLCKMYCLRRTCYDIKPLMYLFSSLYTFDMRFLESPVMVHMDHVSAVLDVDYSPTGKEFVSASFDKSIRIFPVDKGHSRWVVLHLSILLSFIPVTFSQILKITNSFINIFIGTFDSCECRNLILSVAWGWQDLCSWLNSGVWIKSRTT